MPDVSARYRRPATSSPSRTGERVALNLRLLVVSEDFAPGSEPQKWPARSDGVCARAPAGAGSAAAGSPAPAGSASRAARAGARAGAHARQPRARDRDREPAPAHACPPAPPSSSRPARARGRAGVCDRRRGRARLFQARILDLQLILEASPARSRQPGESSPARCSPAPVRRPLALAARAPEGDAVVLPLSAPGDRAAAARHGSPPRR